MNELLFELNKIFCDISSEDFFISTNKVGEKISLSIDYGKFSEAIFYLSSRGASDYEISNLYFMRNKQIQLCKSLSQKYSSKYIFNSDFVF